MVSSLSGNHSEADNTCNDRAHGYAYSKDNLGGSVLHIWGP